MRRLRLPSSLGARLSLAAAAAVAVAVILASVGSYVAVRAKLRGQVDSALENRADLVDNVRRVLVAPPGLRRFSLPAPEFGGAAGFVQLITSAGQVPKSSVAGSQLPVSDHARQVAAGNHQAFLADEIGRASCRERV